jgi:hypothetical protein
MMREYRKPTGGYEWIHPTHETWKELRHHGSWMLRRCALCGAELREYNHDDEGYRRDDRLDYDDHDRCNCETRAVCG